MAILSDVDLAIEADIIQNESSTGANTADRVGQMFNDIIDSKVNVSATYKEYISVMLQSGTGDPTATLIYFNSIGNIVWSRISTGVYRGFLTGAFLNNKVYSYERFIGISPTDSILVGRYNNDYLELNTYSSGVLTDGLLNYTPIEFKVFN